MDRGHSHHLYPADERTSNEIEDGYEPWFSSDVTMLDGMISREINE